MESALSNDGRHPKRFRSIPTMEGIVQDSVLFISERERLKRKKSLLRECPIRMRRPGDLRVPLDKNGEKMT